MLIVRENAIIVIIFLLFSLFFYTTATFADNEHEEYEHEREFEGQGDDENEEVNIINEISGELGTIALFLSVLTIANLFIRWTNKYLFSSKSLVLTKLRVLVSKVHPYLGLLLLTFALIHGFLLFNQSSSISIMCNLIIMMLLIIVFTALARKILKIKNWLIIHRSCTYFLLFLILIHIIVLD